MVAILVLKTHLILYKPKGDWYEDEILSHLQLEMTYSLLTHLPDHPQWDLTQVCNIMHSPWPAHIPIFPLNMNPLQFDYGLQNKSGPDNFTMIPINYVECHKEIGLHCIWNLSEMSYLSPVVFYAQDHWINHILNALPSDKTLQVLLDKVALLNEEDARRALEWAEGAKESHDQLAQQLIMQIWGHLEPQPAEIASDGSQSGRGTVHSNVHISQNNAQPSLIVEKPTTSIDVNQLSENQVPQPVKVTGDGSQSGRKNTGKHRWMKKLRHWF
ncbi:hypothetical protein BT96DRAFT_234786 [Gymnopus androsaceus JB14]|uniref:Uncharacterized protein n=1 Tax=Gymnopus androsaceus JB14 TaxID=1447944 RepID=A0A6A4IRV9_9AGAR|nr:hypothetical protein BT96DRAFT_234786 [Gymnopus androsaceus JB14]